MNFRFVEPWSAFLPREGGHVLGISGSGGKTSLLMHLAAHYRAAGIPSVLATTTRTEVLEDVRACDLGNAPEDPAPDAEPLFVHAGMDSDGKWRGISPGEVDRLSSTRSDAVFVVETDGAGKRPLKLYRSGEPCWPQQTSLALVVVGLQALGEPVSSAIHRWGRAGFAPLAELADDTTVTWQHLEALLVADGGYLQQVPQRVPIVLVLTGIRHVRDSLGLFDFMDRIMTERRVPLAMLCELNEDPVSLRTVCRDESDAVGAP